MFKDLSKLKEKKKKTTLKSSLKVGRFNVADSGDSVLLTKRAVTQACFIRRDVPLYPGCQTCRWRMIKELAI